VIPRRTIPKFCGDDSLYERPLLLAGKIQERTSEVHRTGSVSVEMDPDRLAVAVSCLSFPVALEGDGRYRLKRFVLHGYWFRL
jgi:hypothetical protein